MDEVDLLFPHGEGGTLTGVGEFGAVGSSIIGIGFARHETTVNEAIEVSRQGAGRDPEATSELTESQGPTGERLEGCGLGDGHSAAGDIGALGQ